MTPLHNRHKEEKLSGVGMLVLSNKSPRNEVIAFNKQTLSRYNGRKRQYIDFNFARESTSLMASRERGKELDKDNESRSIQQPL